VLCVLMYEVSRELAPPYISDMLSYDLLDCKAVLRSAGNNDVFVSNVFSRCLRLEQRAALRLWNTLSVEFKTAEHSKVDS